MRAHTYSFGRLVCFSAKEKKRCEPLFLSLFLSPLGTHAPWIGCVVSPIQDSCTGWLSLRSPLCLHTHPMYPCIHTHTHCEAISHPLYTASLLPNTHMHMYPCHRCSCSTRLRPELTLIFTLFLYILSPCLPALTHPTPTLFPSALRSSVTTAVCQLSACPRLVRDEAETQRVYREDGLDPLSLPAVTPTSDFHLS